MTERMMSLRETVARALWDDHAPPGYAEWDQVSAVHGQFLRAADAALEALGLNDFDAAVRRGAQALRDALPTSTARVLDPEARAVLEAALSATGEGQS